MGNFSNDPQARLTESIGKHYIAVRMQQAVPVLDADWNLLDDLRRNQVEQIGSWFIGDGVPTGSDGFAIFAVATANDFGIRNGTCIVSGQLTVNDAGVTYATQPHFSDPAVFPALTPLSTPAADKSFIAYLDVWSREVDSQQDPGLVDARIGVETAVRLKRDWAVRVARVPEDLPLLAAPPRGHVFLRLAQIDRLAGNANITAAMIDDLRNTQLSILRKIQVLDSTGAVLVDNTRFGLMLRNTSTNVLTLLNYLTTQFNPPFSSLTFAETLGLQAVALVAQTAQAGLANLNALTLANGGALAFLGQLYTVEENFMTVWSNVVLQLGTVPKKYSSYANFVNTLDQLLNNPVVGTFTGLLPAITAGDLNAAVTTQEEIANLIGNAGSSVARGSIQIAYTSAPPGILSPSPSPARFQFQVTSFTTQADTYTVTILPAAGWPRVLVNPITDNPIPGNLVTIPASGGVTTLFLDVTVQAGSSGLQLQVVSNSNPTEIKQSSTLLTLTSGQNAPPTQNQVQFSLETPFHATIGNGVVNVSKPPAPPGSIGVRIFNSTGQDAVFTVAATVMPGTAVGTWTVPPIVPATVAVSNGGNASAGGVSVTVAGDSVSCQVSFTATATVSGASVVGEIIIPFVAS